MEQFLSNGNAMVTVEPKFMQIANHIYDLIQKNYYRNGDKIESEEILMQKFSVSRGTVRKAIESLKQDGLLETIKGSGTYVVRDNLYFRAKFVSFLIPVEYCAKGLFYEFYADVLSSMEKYAKQYKMKIVFASYNSSEEYALMKEVADNIGDAGFLTRNISPQILNMLKEKNIPIISIGNRLEDVDGNYVVADNEYGAFLATEYLLKLGHKRVAHITHDLSRATGLTRFGGYKKALQAYKMPLEETLLLETKEYDLDSEWLQKELHELVVVHGATAIFAGNDRRAIACIDALDALGIQVPQQVSVIGFDDINIAKSRRYNLTTIGVDKDLMAKYSVEQMAALLGQSDVVHQEWRVPVQLIERNTCSVYQAACEKICK